MIYFHFPLASGVRLTAGCWSWHLLHLLLTHKHTNLVIIIIVKQGYALLCVMIVCPHWSQKKVVINTRTYCAFIFCPISEVLFWRIDYSQTKFKVLERVFQLCMMWGWMVVRWGKREREGWRNGGMRGVKGGECSKECDRWLRKALVS